MQTLHELDTKKELAPPTYNMGYQLLTVENPDLESWTKFRTELKHSLYAFACLNNYMEQHND